MQGHAPLHLAAYKGSWQVVKELLNHQADKTIKSQNVKKRFCSCTFVWASLGQVVYETNACT